MYSMNILYVNHVSGNKNRVMPPYYAFFHNYAHHYTPIDMYKDNAKIMKAKSEPLKTI